MARTRSPLVGYNTNVNHLGQVFHIQTEDSGHSRPHVITQLFADGGRIIAAEKTEYKEHIGKPNETEIVKRIMQEQHTAVFVALRSGTFDGAMSPTDASNGVLAGSGAEVTARGNAKAAPATTQWRAASPPTESVTSHRPAPKAEHEPESMSDLPPPLPGERRSYPPSERAPRYEVVEARRSISDALRTSNWPSRAFGSQTVTEQTLDEVILSYLALDLTRREGA